MADVCHRFLIRPLQGRCWLSRPLHQQQRVLYCPLSPLEGQHLFLWTGITLLWSCPRPSRPMMRIVKQFAIMPIWQVRLVGEREVSGPSAMCLM